MLKGVYPGDRISTSPELHYSRILCHEFLITENFSADQKRFLQICVQLHLYYLFEKYIVLIIFTGTEFGIFIKKCSLGRICEFLSFKYIHLFWSFLREETFWMNVWLYFTKFWGSKQFHLWNLECSIFLILYKSRFNNFEVITWSVKKYF